MGTRLDFQGVLENLLEGLNVYFQPPSNDQMSYPAIIYNRDYKNVLFADNSPYRGTTRYQITVIDANPDSALPDLVAQLPLTTYVRHYTTQGLNHDIFYVYF